MNSRENGHTSCCSKHKSDASKGISWKDSRPEGVYEKVSVLIGDKADADITNS